eukprot:5907966-Amphidinium_carterae.4
MTPMAVSPSQTLQATPRDDMEVNEGLQTVVHQWQAAAAQQMQVAQQEHRDMHSNQLMAIQRSLPLRSVPHPPSVTSREDLLRQFDKFNIPQIFLDMKRKPMPMKRQGLQQNVAGLQQSQATLGHMVHQHDVVIREANICFTRLPEEYQTAEQVTSHLIGFIGSTICASLNEAGRNWVGIGIDQRRKIFKLINTVQLTQVHFATPEWPVMTSNSDGVARLLFSPAEQLVVDHQRSPSLGGTGPRRDESRHQTDTVCHHCHLVVSVDSVFSTEWIRLNRDIDLWSEMTIESFLRGLRLEARNSRDEIRLDASVTRMARQGKKNAGPYANSAEVPKGKDKVGKSKGLQARPRMLLAMVEEQAKPQFATSDACDKFHPRIPWSPDLH